MDFLFWDDNQFIVINVISTAAIAVSNYLLWELEMIRDRYILNHYISWEKAL